MPRIDLQTALGGGKPHTMLAVWRGCRARVQHKTDAIGIVAAGGSVILAVAHRDYVNGGWSLVAKLLKGGQGIVLDVKAKLERAKKPEGIDLWRL